jgi:selenocysteine lyase/cysteine desulfurase
MIDIGEHTDTIRDLLPWQAATSQKPQAVLDAVMEYLTTGNANAARGTYSWANRTTALIARVEDQLRSFLGDPGSGSGVHFVSGTTEGLRTVARDWLVPQLRPGDEIIVPFADHSANIVSRCGRCPTTRRTTTTPTGCGRWSARVPD